MRSSFVQSLQIQSLKSITELVLFFSNIFPPIFPNSFLERQKGLTADDYATLCVKITNTTALSEVHLYAGKISYNNISLIFFLDDTAIDDMSLEVLTKQVHQLKDLWLFVINAPSTKVTIQGMKAISEKLKEIGLVFEADDYNLSVQSINLYRK